MPAHFIDQRPSQCWSLSYYHPKLKLNGILRSQKLQQSPSETQLWSTIRLQSIGGAMCICARLPSLVMGLSPLAHGWSFAAASDGTFCRAISAYVCSCLSCLTLKMPCLLKYKQNPSRYCVNPSINQTYIKHLLSTVPGISRQENTKILQSQSLGN